MQIRFVLLWSKSIGPSKAFKSKSAGALFEEYIHRIKPFANCETHYQLSEVKSGGYQLWLCDRMRNQKVISSENLSEKLNQTLLSGIKTLDVVIGGPDGVDENWIQKNKPHFIWSFGPLTLPHELAAVVASEQIYRAWSILKNLPYHKGH